MERPVAPTGNFPLYPDHKSMSSTDSSAEAQPMDEEARGEDTQGVDDGKKEQTERGRKLFDLLLGKDERAAFNHRIAHAEEARPGVRRQVETKAQELRELGHESDAESLMRELERLEENAPATPTQTALLEEGTEG